MRKIVRILLVMVLASTLASCASKQYIMRGNFNQEYSGVSKEEVKKYWNLLLEPYDAVCIGAPLTDNIREYESPFPEELKKEQYIKERIRWFVLISSNIRRYLGQIIRWKPIDSDIFLSRLLVDGVPDEELKDSKAVILSTRAGKVFEMADNAKGIDVDCEKLMTNVAYQEEIINKYGTSFYDFVPSKTLIREIPSWTWHNTPRGLIASPPDVSKERFRQIVSINPGNTFTQRWVEGHHEISTNPFSIIRNGISDINSALREPNIEWKSKNRKIQEE